MVRVVVMCRVLCVVWCVSFVVCLVSFLSWLCVARHLVCVVCCLSFGVCRALCVVRCVLPCCPSCVGVCVCRLGCVVCCVSFGVCRVLRVVWCVSVVWCVICYVRRVPANLLCAACPGQFVVSGVSVPRNARGPNLRAARGFPGLGGNVVYTFFEFLKVSKASVA